MKVELKKEHMKEDDCEWDSFDIRLIPETEEDKQFISYFENEDDYVEKFVDKKGRLRFLI